MNFRSKSKKIAEAYEKKRHLPVLRSQPVSSICESCWGRSACIRTILQRQPPTTCCVYTLFSSQDANTTTVEDMVSYTCGKACVDRQSWTYDDVPHDAHYCKDHCPVSRFLLDMGPSDYDS